MRITGLEPAPPIMGQESESYKNYSLICFKYNVFIEISTFSYIYMNSINLCKIV